MKILIIGNKQDIEDKSNKIKELNPDIVFRINKCNSWEKTKTKTDKITVWLMDICRENLAEEFAKIPKDCLDSLKNSGKLFFYENSKNVSLHTIMRFCSLNSLRVIRYNGIDIRKYFPKYDFYTNRPDNFIWILLFVLEYIKVKDKEIYITACDIEDRSYLKDNRFHQDIIIEEQELLKKLINENKVKVL